MEEQPSENEANEANEAQRVNLYLDKDTLALLKEGKSQGKSMSQTVKELVQASAKEHENDDEAIKKFAPVLEFLKQVSLIPDWDIGKGLRYSYVYSKFAGRNREALDYIIKSMREFEKIGRLPRGLKPLDVAAFYDYAITKFDFRAARWPKAFIVLDMDTNPNDFPRRNCDLCQQIKPIGERRIGDGKYVCGLCIHELHNTDSATDNDICDLEEVEENVYDWIDDMVKRI